MLLDCSIICDAVNVADRENAELFVRGSVSGSCCETEIAEDASRLAESPNSPVLSWCSDGLIFCVKVIV
jgi:hypothetical protein